MFADGIITGRGFLDVRVEFNDSMQGEVAIDNINPKNVIIDPDGEAYDPATWSEVFTTKWLTADDIAVMYSTADAELLRNRDQSYFPYGYDSINNGRDRFGNRDNPQFNGVYDESNVLRSLRVIERQYRVLDKQEHFVSPETGDTRPIPEEFDRDRIAFFVNSFGFKVIKKLVRRIKWTVIADNVVLHDDWSPYENFTIVPFFPHFRHGATIGLVENLLSSQELLNKVSSQELHVVNTTANSGWIVKAGTLVNMAISELETRGAETGLVVEVSEMDALQKITPNTVPSGLDRVSFKAEDHIKSISGVSDSMQGFDREDVAAKAIAQKKQSGATNLAKPLDNLTRTDHILAGNILNLIQNFYTEERLLTITKDRMTGESESFTINQATPDGQIINDLTLGEYGVVISSVPQRETLEDSQFEQAMAMREAGIQIPDEVLIQSSRLVDKKDVLEKINAAKNSPEAQATAKVQQEQLQADVSKTNAEVQQKTADAGLKQAKAQKETIVAQKDAATPPEQGDGGAGVAAAKASADMQLNQQKFSHQQELDFAKLRVEREKIDADLHMRAQEQADKQAQARIDAATAAAKPQPKAKV
jgi:hypothetical protein